MIKIVKKIYSWLNDYVSDVPKMLFMAPILFTSTVNNLLENKFHIVFFFRIPLLVFILGCFALFLAFIHKNITKK